MYCTLCFKPSVKNKQNQSGGLEYNVNDSSVIYS